MSASGQLGGLRLSAGSSGGGFRVRGGGASHRGHALGRLYDAAALDGCAFFEVDELVGGGSQRKRKRRVLCVTPMDVLTLVAIKEHSGTRARARGGSTDGHGCSTCKRDDSSSNSSSSSSSGGENGARARQLLHVKSKLPLRNVGAIAFKERHNVSLDLTTAAALRLTGRARGGGRAHGIDRGRSSNPTSYTFYSPRARAIAAAVAQAQFRASAHARRSAPLGGGGDDSAPTSGAAGIMQLAAADEPCATTYAQLAAAPSELAPVRRSLAAMALRALRGRLFSARARAGAGGSGSDGTHLHASIEQRGLLSAREDDEVEAGAGFELMMSHRHHHQEQQQQQGDDDEINVVF